jgi:hypothetical protein
MIVAISFHDGDLELMTRWANHVQKLGPYLNHNLVLLPVHNASTEEISQILTGSFSGVLIENCHHSEQGWPISCNKAFETMAWAALQKYQQPFLWMEPDAVPLKKGWIDEIEKEYQKCQKPFMGDFVKIAGVMPNGVDHMSGIAVYHHNMPQLAPSIFNNESIAWDIASGKDVVRKMHKTDLIHHDWIPDKKWRRDVVTPDCVKEGAVIYHPDKKGVLFNDGLSPNGTQGDPAAGVPCEGIPHETKETKLSSGTPESVDMAIKNAINVLSFHSNLDEKNKKKISKWLIEANLTKAKNPIKPRKKVRSSVGKRGRPRAGSGIPIPSDSQVEV